MASNNNGRTDDSVSAMSGISDDNTTSSKLSVMAHAAMLLMGKNPTIPEEQQSDASTTDDQVLGLSVVAKTTTTSNQEQARVSWRTPVKSDEVEAPKIDFLQDDPSTMTYSRRLALKLMKSKWYNPHANDNDNNTQQDEQQQEDLNDTIHPLLRYHSLSERGFDVDSLATADNNHLTLAAYPFTHARKETPSLAKAWGYFEHVALSRYVVPDQRPKPKKNFIVRAVRRLCCKGSQQLQRAEPGEDKIETALYRPFFTPHAQLGDFGLGIGLYFSTLRAITVLTLLAGLLNLPNMYYFSSTDYQPNVSNFQSYLNSDSNTPTLLQGSAVCTDVSWVICKDCVDHDFDESRKTPATNVLKPLEDNPATLYLRNNCSQDNIQASMINYGTLLFVMIGTIGLNQYLKRMEVTFDIDEQTAQDYSIVIDNPPGDATDPQEWHDFFKTAFDGAHVTACTVAVDNDLLVRSLVERRELLRTIEMMVDPGTSLDTLTLAGIAAKEERERRIWGHVKAKLVPGIPELFGRIAVLTGRVQGLAQQDYPATNVFVTFETEEAQRSVLTALNLGSRQVHKNNTSVVKEEHLFRGQYVLGVSEPDEPNTVRWQDLNEKWKDRMKQQFYTTLTTVASIVVIAFLVWWLSETNNTFSAFAIAIFNSVFPLFAKLLTDAESHSSEGHKQRSLYLKIALFRWANTAIVITIITPFTSTLAEGELIQQIYALFFAEIVTTNLIQLLDPMGHIERHLLAPRAATQDAMNLKMRGQVVELAERYTNMTKILFLALWYSAVYPGALFLCCFALLINYFTDRFSLMRTWKKPPMLGTKMSEFSRRYFFSLALVAMAVMSSYYWAAFPFDNLCEDGEATASFAGLYRVLMDGKELLITVESNETAYKYCNQDFFRFPKSEWAFPFVSELQLDGQEWMSGDQEIITDIYGWSAVAVIGLILLGFVYGWYNGFMSTFRGTYKPNGDVQGINFSDVPSISCYIPEVESSVFSYPLLACNVDNITNKDLMEWNDPDRPFSFYDLTKDAAVLLRGTDVGSKVVFSQIAYWAPEPEPTHENGGAASSGDVKEDTTP